MVSAVWGSSPRCPRIRINGKDPIRHPDRAGEPRRPRAPDLPTRVATRAARQTRGPRRAATQGQRVTPRTSVNRVHAPGVSTRLAMATTHETPKDPGPSRACSELAVYHPQSGHTQGLAKRGVHGRAGERHPRGAHGDPHADPRSRTLSPRSVDGCPARHGPRGHSRALPMRCLPASVRSQPQAHCG